ncbi:MAG: glycosyltransferase family 4 protein [Gemmatimonadota bacterium]|nr:glycosyltransferase family 4 protein [Gemmatimonadota bacterium]
MQHLLVTLDFIPDLSGAARRFVALARCYPEPMSVSTVASRDAAAYDSREDYTIERQPFSEASASSFIARFRWERWLATRARGRVHVLHCTDIATTGRITRRAHKRLRVPYILHVSGPELSRMRVRARTARSARRTLRLVLGDASGIVAPTEYVAAIARETMTEINLSYPPPVLAAGLGADAELFSPGRDSGSLRQRWGIRRAPIMLTVGQLLPGNGQDTGIRALALLRDDFPHLRYVLVGEGSDEIRLRNLAADLHVLDRVGFAGAMRDDELPEAYATSTLYLDAARQATEPGAEGYGLALIEAQAAGLPIVAPDGIPARAVIRNAEAAALLAVSSPEMVAESVAALLRDPDRRIAMSLAGREAVEGHMNWTRVARDTARFVRECVANG